MTNIRDISVKNKLILMQMITTLFVLVILSVFLYYNNLRTERISLVEQLNSMAQLIGENSKSAINFMDNATADELLSSLAYEDDIVNAWIHNSDGELFAKYSKAGYASYSYPQIESDMHEFAGYYLVLSRRILQDGELIGTISIRSEMNLLMQNIEKSIRIPFFALIAGLIIALLLSILTQRDISNPILRLAEAIKRVSSTGNFAVRINKEGKDEIGSLYDGFNNMMEQINIRESERFDAENALRESEKKFRRVFEASNDAMMLIDDHLIFDCNSSSLKMFGFSAEDDLIGRHLYEFCPPLQSQEEVSKKALEKQFINAVQEGRSFFEYTFRKKSSDDFPAEVLLTPIKIEGKVIIQATIRDITNRKKIEKELTKHRENLEEMVKARTLELVKINRELEIEKANIDQLFDTAQEAIVMADKKGRILRINKEFTKLFKYTDEEALGKYVDELIAPEDYHDEATLITRNVVKGEKVALETVRKTKDGESIQVSVLASPIIVEDKLISIYAIYQDITQRKWAEAALEERAKKLAQINVRLKEADRMKSQFLANMSHELRTPLNSIIGFTGILLMGMSGEINEEQNKQLKMIKNSSEHLLSLINDILDISKIEAGKIDLLIEQFTLKEITDEVGEFFLPALNDKGLELLKNIPGDIILHTDKRRFKQVLMNLVTNAVKFTEKGSITINAAKSSEDLLKIYVIDTGIGIREDDMGKLFKSFQQIDMSSSKKYEGTGLGLNLSKKLMVLMGGDITAESVFSEGSSFIISLPLFRGD